MSAEFRELWDKAEAAGMAAGRGESPTPMVVSDGRVKHFISEGACGFAWVVVKPGNCAFAKWAKKEKAARPEYGGGMCVKWVSEFNQSVDRKAAYAGAFAKVLHEGLGGAVTVVARDRLD